MRAYIPLAYLVIASFLITACADDNIVQTGEIRTWSDPDASFQDYQTFSLLTAEMAPPPPDSPDIPDDLIDEAELFNETVNGFIRQAMQNPPVCLEFIPPDDVTDENQPDVFAANALAVSTEEGTVWTCIGGWWWGYWGWYWDPCKWVIPVPVETEQGNMLIPVGPPPPTGEDPAPVFAGLAQALLVPGQINETTIQNAVNFIFSQWPDPRTCEPTTP